MRGKVSYKVSLINKMYLKIHDSYRKIVAVCDSDLVGKKFEEGIKQLDVRESFFKGEEIAERELQKIMIDESKDDSTFNIVGKKSVELAMNAGILTEKSIGHVEGIPFALIFL